MKNLILLLLLFILLLSCADFSIEEDFWYMSKDYSYITRLSECYRVKNQWQHNDYYDFEVYGRIDHIQTPHETETLGSGDCDDFCVATLGIINKVFGYKGSLQLVWAYKSGNYLDGVYHYQIKVEGELHLTALSYDSFDIIKEIKFDDIPEYSANRR